MKSLQGSYMKSPTPSWSGKFCLVRQALQIHYTIPLRLLCTTWHRQISNCPKHNSLLLFSHIHSELSVMKGSIKLYSEAMQHWFNKKSLPILLFQFFWLHDRQGLCCVGFGWSWFAHLDVIENFFNANFVSYTTGKGWVVLRLVETGLRIWMWLNKISLMLILLATQQERVQLCWVW